VTAGIHDPFVEGLTDRLKKLVVDDALNPRTEMGPVVDENQLDQDLRYLDIGKSEGARLHWGGERLDRATPGFYLQPAVFTEATNQMRIAREEIFGPVAAVIRRAVATCNRFHPARSSFATPAAMAALTIAGARRAAD
jgi:acyl-CoA reductase-like NAD-dependent aldehyde dehydrogenase